MRTIYFLFFLAACNTASVEGPDVDPESAAQMRRQLNEERYADSLIQSGFVSQAKLDIQTKCNLRIGFYILNRTDIDSAGLRILTHRLASQLYIKQSLNSDPDCEYQVMSSAFVYLSEEDMKNEVWISMCSFTPSEFGRVSFMPFKLDELKR